MKIFDNLPTCSLIEVLEEKISNQNEKHNDLCVEIAKFITEIAQELRYINELFPEYTPHDKDYHISHLFRISDILLGKGKYEKMNVIELLLLMVSMYAHDWGMAVSKTERCAIATKDKTSPNLLYDEFERFNEFINAKLGKTNFESDEDIAIDIWQDYIRNTHAIRSGKRIENYFNKTNGSFASALNKICVGHWLEIEEVNDRNGYYKDASVCGETINLRAITIYIRLIDLFDLAEDRTPYVLWKYVNPQNAYSKMEWSKHRALHQITCPSYDSGRSICISGSTDDHKVYAALMDFKNLCDRYFRECSNALAHMGDTRHELGVYFLDWRIEAKNFKPISVQFDFERKQIFKVLSDEIYDCHPYVYIRELIQNCIDAITFRKQILEHKKVGGENIGYIFIDINKITESDIEIVCKDDGVGMDEYIIKNYFSVLGKSYYNSKEFENKNTNMSPISKFGVGILSCFSIATQMEILTKREPYMAEGKKGLKIIIDDISKTFRVEELSEFTCEVGTTVKLKVKQTDLIKHLEKNDIKYEDFSITKYIKHIAGFVPYPIIINDLGTKTILISKELKREQLSKNITNFDDYVLVKTQLDYPTDRFIKPQDINNFNTVFETIAFDICDDFGIDNLEGKLIFPALKDYNFEIKNIERCWPPSEVFVSDNKNKYRLRWNSHLHTANDLETYYLEVHNNGILLEKYQLPWKFSRYRFIPNLFPVPYLKLNVKNSIADISISRFNSNSIEKMIEIIWDKLSAYISSELLDLSTKINDYDFWRKLTIYLLQYHVNIEQLDKSIFDDIRYPFVNTKGELTYLDVKNEEVLLLAPSTKKINVNVYFENKNYEEKPSENWLYGKCLLARSKSSSIQDDIASNIPNTVYSALSKNYFLDEVKFITDPQIEYPLVQEIWKKGKSISSIDLIKQILEEYNIKEYDDKKIKEAFPNWIPSKKLVKFSNENKNYAFYGCYKLNISNPKVKSFIVYKWILFQLQKNNIDKKEFGKYKDILDDLPFINNRFLDENVTYSFSKINKSLSDLHYWIKNKYPSLKSEKITIANSDFLPNSIKTIDPDHFEEFEKLKYEA